MWRRRPCCAAGACLSLQDLGADANMARACLDLQAAFTAMGRPGPPLNIVVAKWEIPIEYDDNMGGGGIGFC